MGANRVRARVILPVAAAACLLLAAAGFNGADTTSASVSTTATPLVTRLSPRPAIQGAVAAFGEEDYPLVARFDVDKNGWLDAEERRGARAFAEANGYTRRIRRFGFDYQPEPGPKLSPDDVKPYPTTALFDQETLRTLFLTFENDEWESELMAFKATDVDVPATLVVDGKTYRNVGIQFHGNSSFNAVPPGFKHSMRLALDFVDEDQRLGGFRSLLLLNAHEDPSYLRSLLAMAVARDYYPAPRANLVRVVINGESWGIFVNQQHFNRDMTEDLFKIPGGARWRVHGTRADTGGGLAYLGESDAAYRSVYDLRTADRPEPWETLKRLTRVLEQTPPAELEAALAPLLDVDGTLRFLAVENAIVNTDGYWTKASDYNLFMEPSGRFHLLPYDVNGTFASGFGPATSRTGSIALGPFDAAQDPSKPLLLKLLAVPALRQRYVGYVREVANKWLDWTFLGPIVEAHHNRIAGDVESETRKLVSLSAFRASAAELKSFADARRETLLKMTGSAADGR